MSRIVIIRIGAAIASGFLIASGCINFVFGASLGRSPSEAVLYGSVGVLSVGMNALLPFFLSWSFRAARKTATAGIALLWALCLAYSTTSSLGFAAQNRETVSLSRQVASDAYEDSHRELLDLLDKRRDARAKDRPSLDAKIDAVRHRLDTLRANPITPADAQSEFLATLSFGALHPRQVRMVLVALFALLVELAATLGLFAALSNIADTPPPSKRWSPRAQ